MLSSRPGLLLAAGLAAFSFVGCGTSPAPTAGAPTITTQPAAATVVSGAAATLAVAATGNGTLTYQWRKDGTVLPGGTAASLALPAVTAANAGVYDCIVTNTLGSASQVAVSSGAIVAVNTAPVIVAQPAAQSTAVGGNVIFMVAASGNGTLGYQWKKDGVDILGANQASYLITSASASHAGNYSCVVSNKLGATSTSTATASAGLTVSAGSATSPAISSQPAALTVAAGGNASFTVAATGNGTVTYQWRKDGVVLPGATQATLSFTAVTPANAGVYDCVVTNTLGATSSMAVSAGAFLSVNGAPVILAQPTNQVATASGSVTFTVVAAGSGTLGYQWRKDGAGIAGATSPSYTVPSVAAGDAGSYDCVVTSTLGSTTSSTTSAAAALSIATSPLITGQSGTQTLVEGGSASFTVTASSAGTLSYQWFKGSNALTDGGSVSGATTASLTLTGVVLGDAANYSCLVTSKQ
ncbi:MAG TPA: immunoglobulin domain-containing protein, partial [Myxococcales bacterium]|nr:immunoglobulin domain-containing protein [Myxococcales bacterium]